MEGMVGAGDRGLEVPISDALATRGAREEYVVDDDMVPERLGNGRFWSILFSSKLPAVPGLEA